MSKKHVYILNETSDWTGQFVKEFCKNMKHFVRVLRTEHKAGLFHNNYFQKQSYVLMFNSTTFTF